MRVAVSLLGGVEVGILFCSDWKRMGRRIWECLMGLSVYSYTEVTRVYVGTQLSIYFHSRHNHWN